jgi:hypothetical protein
MLLKYFLLTHYTAAKLKADFRHDLKKLWRAFKKATNEPVLARFDGLVSALNKIEDLRYPGRGYSFIMEPRKGPRPRVFGPATRGQIHYRVNLEEIDEYFAELLTGRVTPGWIRTLLRREDAMLQYKRENLHPFI